MSPTTLLSTIELKASRELPRIVSTFFTDSWSSVVGLASVAYGSPDRYPEVANQLRSKAPASFLGNVLPSDIMREGISESVFSSALQEEYEEGEGFARFVDSQGFTVSSIAKRYYPRLVKGFDENSSYENSLSSVLGYVMEETGINQERVKNFIVSSFSDSEVYASMAINVPSNKLDKVPPNTLFSLDNLVELSSDSNGVDFPTGYLTPSEYYEDVGFPGSQETLLKSVGEGYKTYPYFDLLDNVLRPAMSEVVNPDDLSKFNSVNRSIAGLGTLDTIRDLTGIGTMSDADRAMYEVDLTSIIVNLNGYTVYNPLTDSNGDFIDTSLVPDYNSNNSDPGSGLPYSTRTRSTAFES